MRTALCLSSVYFSLGSIRASSTREAMPGRKRRGKHMNNVIGLPWLRRASGVLLLLSLGGCEGSATKKDAGGDASEGAGGAIGGAPGGGGAGGADAAEPPSCLRALFAACPIEGTCTYADVDGGATTRYCYGSGTRAEYTTQGSCNSPSPLTRVGRVTKPNGSLCYTVETRVGQNAACEGLTFVFKDAAGEVVASGFTGSLTTTVSCATGGETAACAFNATCAVDVSTEVCEPGDCP
jgi:hypothetical protein